MKAEKQDDVHDSMWNYFLCDCLLAISLHSNQGLTGTENNLIYRNNVMWGDKVTSPKLSCGSLPFLPHYFISEWSPLYNFAFSEFQCSF